MKVPHKIFRLLYSLYNHQNGVGSRFSIESDLKITEKGVGNQVQRI